MNAQEPDILNIDNLDSKDIIDALPHRNIVTSKSINGILFDTYSSMPLRGIDVPTFILKSGHWTLALPVSKTLCVYFDPYGLEMPLANSEILRLGLAIDYQAVSYQPVNQFDRLCGNYCIYACALFGNNLKSSTDLHLAMQKFLRPIPKTPAFTEAFGHDYYPVGLSSNTYLMIDFSIRRRIGSSWNKNKSLLVNFETFVTSLYM